MDTVICPNCGHEFSVPKKKVSSIKCPKCNMDGLELVLIISMKMMNLENLSSKDILKLLPRHFLPDGLLEKGFCGG